MLPSGPLGGYASVCLDGKREVAVTVWGFLAVLVVSVAVAALYLRSRSVADVDAERRKAQEKARADAADASIQRQRTAAQIAAEGEAKAQSANVTVAARETQERLDGDLTAQSASVAEIIGAGKPATKPQGGQ